MELQYYSLLTSASYLHIRCMSWGRSWIPLWRVIARCTTGSWVNRGANDSASCQTVD